MVALSHLVWTENSAAHTHAPFSAARNYSQTQRLAHWNRHRLTVVRASPSQSRQNANAGQRIPPAQPSAQHPAPGSFRACISFTCHRLCLFARPARSLSGQRPRRLSISITSPAHPQLPYHSPGTGSGADGRVQFTQITLPRAIAAGNRVLCRNGGEPTQARPGGVVNQRKALVPDHRSIYPIS